MILFLSNLLTFELFFKNLNEISATIILTIELCILQVWDFKTCKLKSRLDVGKSVTKIAFHRPNGSILVFNIFGIPMGKFSDN